MIILAAVIIICVAFFTEAIFGFGGGLIAVPLLSLLFGVQDAVTTVLIFQLGMGVLLLRNGKHIDWFHAKPLLFGLIAGTIAGTFGLATIHPVLLARMLSLFILVFLTLPFVCRKSPVSHEKSRIVGVLSGMVGGLLQGMIGTGGPVFTMYLSTIAQNKYTFRMTLIFLFFITSILRMGTSFTLGLFNQQVLTIAAYALVPYALLLVAGSKCHERVAPRHFKTGIHLVLLLAAVSLLMKS